MTSIKPPLPPVISGADPTAGTIGPTGVEGATGPAQSGAAAAVGPVATAGSAAPADPIADLAAAIARGELSAAQAMDRLVDRALAGVSAHLDTAQRAELAGVLRAALDGDPAVRDALGSDSAG